MDFVFFSFRKLSINRILDNIFFSIQYFYNLRFHKILRNVKKSKLKIKMLPLYTEFHFSGLNVIGIPKFLPPSIMISAQSFVV